jgi:hypothetical protein
LGEENNHFENFELQPALNLPSKEAVAITASQEVKQPNRAGVAKVYAEMQRGDEAAQSGEFSSPDSSR